jgi:uncharacterized protein (UPF0332 family)
MNLSSRIKQSLEESEAYVEAAKKQYQDALDSSVWNPVIVNCIMSMIKSVDALMLESRGKTVKDHSKTSNKLKKLYDDKEISEGFKSNIDSVKKWVVKEKSEIQYRNKKVSQKDADKAIKSAERLLKKTRKEIK